MSAREPEPPRQPATPQAALVTAKSSQKAFYDNRTRLKAARLARQTELKTMGK